MKTQRKVIVTSLFFSIGCILMSFVSASKKGEALKVGTFNIRYYTPKDVNDSWESRNIILEKLLKKYDFDILGTQEPFRNQLNDMLQYLAADYDYVGTSITGDSTVSGKHFNAIFYKKAKFEVLDNGIFWLSPTPDVVNSKGWDSYSVRMCTWALFKDKRTGKEFYHFNLHFDHKGEQARIESAKLIVSRIQQIAGEKPAFLTGDFNVDQRSEAYKIIAASLKDSRDLATKKENADWHTLNSFKYSDTPFPKGRQIDHVFVNGGGVKTWKLINDDYNHKYPSDHFPIIIEWTP